MKKPPCISPYLLWEYERGRIDWKAMKKAVIQRVIERGWPSDWSEMFRYYGYQQIREVVKTIPFTSPRDRNFVCVVFSLTENELWSTEKRLQQLHSL